VDRAQFQVLLHQIDRAQPFGTLERIAYDGTVVVLVRQKSLEGWQVICHTLLDDRSLYKIGGLVFLLEDYKTVALRPLTALK
jgi:hypothetical protein